MKRIAFRCDGDDRLGAGHVARCLRLAAAMERRGAHCELVGSYAGAAAELVQAAGVANRPAEAGSPAGRPPGADGLVVDSYELPHAEVEAAARELPVAAVVDGDAAPDGVTVLSYHPDAASRLPSARGPRGPDYAPLDPRCAAARGVRGSRRVLVTAGGGEAGDAALAAAIEALGSEHELFVAARTRPLEAPEGIAWGWDEGGLAERLAWADLAVSAAGSTAYELACAGVPALCVVVADNQLQVAQALGAGGMAVALDGRRGMDAGAVGRAWREVLARQEELAAVGPATFDGYGAFRAADGLLAAFDGREPQPPLRYRPASGHDSGVLLGWRNDPDVRAASHSQAEISAAEHETWLAGVLGDPERTLLVVEAAGRPVGTVRFDRHPECAVISVTIAPGDRGQGLGSRVIAEASELYLSSRPDVVLLHAEIREGNRASVAAFERAGYVAADGSATAGSSLLAYTLP